MGSTPPNLSCTVLVVDDDPIVADFMHTLLARQGYFPNVMHDPQVALDWVVASPNPPDVAVVDYFMPRMNGIEFARRLRRMIPGLPLLLLSGAAAVPGLLKDAEWRPCLAMHKPFRVHDLLANLEQLLGRKPPAG